jgi:hypothetical protein
MLHDDPGLPATPPARYTLRVRGEVDSPFELADAFEKTFDGLCCAGAQVR